MPFTLAAMAAVPAGAPALTPGLMAGMSGITAGSVAADVAIAGSAYSGYSTYQQGKAAEDAGKYNMQVSQAEAESIEKASEYETREARIDKRKLQARQLVAFAKGGVVPSAGTPLKIQQQTGADYERDIGMTQYGYGIAGQQTLNKGYMDYQYGKQRKRSSRWMAGSTILTGAGRALEYWSNV